MPGGLALLDSERAEVFKDSLEAYFQTLDDPSDPAVTTVTMMDNEGHTSKSKKPTLINPSVVLQAINGHMFSKALVPNSTSEERPGTST